MKFIETSNPDILMTRRGGGLAMVFGVTFLLTGLLIIGLSFKVTGDIPWYVPAAFGTVFLLLGMAMTFGRNGIVIDRRKRTMVHWFGLMVPMKKTPYRLDKYDHISIRKDIHHAEKRLYNVYPVAIRSRLDRVRGLIFHEPADYIQARNEAKKLATFLGLPIIDVASGEEIVREPGRLDETFQQKEKKIGGRSRSFSPPPVMIARIREKEKLVIEIPPRRLSGKEIKRVVSLVVIGFASLVVIVGFENLKNLRGAQLLVYGPVAMAIILFAVSPVRRAKKSWRITVSGKSLKVEELGSGSKKNTVIPNNELQDLVMGDPVSHGGQGRELSAGRKILADLIEGPGKKAITASSDKATVTFGHGVEERELDYLYQLIRKRIIAADRT